MTLRTPVTAGITIVTTVTGCFVLASGMDVMLPGGLAVGAGCLLTGLVTASKRRTPGGRAIGSVYVVLAAGALAAAVGLSVTGPVPADSWRWFRPAIVLTIALAVFGGTATVTDAVGDGAVRSALPVALLTAVPVTVRAALSSGLLRSHTESGAADALPVGLVSNWVRSPTATIVELALLVGLLSVLCGSVLFVLPRLPIPELLPRSRRDAVRTHIDRGRSWVWIALLLIVCLGLVLIVGVMASIPVPGRGAGLETIVSPVVGSSALRTAVLAIIAVVWLLWLVSLLPALPRARHSRLARWVPVFTGGSLVALPLPIVASTLAQRGSTVPSPPPGTALIGVALVGAIGVVLTLLSVVFVAGAIRLLADRAAPGLLAAGALVGGSIIAGLDGAHLLTVIVPVGCAIVAWDVSVYGVVATAEMGPTISIRRPALAHAMATVSIGLVGIGLTLGVNRVLVGAIPARTTLTVLVCLTVAFLTALVALKATAGRPSRAR